MLRMLNGMQDLLTGEPTFDPVLYQTLLECFDIFDPELLPVSDANWQGLHNYSDTGGNPPDDPWPPCDPDVSWKYVYR